MADAYSIRPMDDINTLRRLLSQNRVIAVVGLSADWFRPSYFAAKYMQEHGYTVIPVNPRYGEILGQKCYPSLREIPVKILTIRELLLPPVLEHIASERRGLSLVTGTTGSGKSNGRSTGWTRRTRGSSPASPTS